MNEIDRDISEKLSSSTVCDFIWVPKFSASGLFAHRPAGIESAGMLLAIHGNGLNIFIKGRRFNITDLAGQMERLPGYSVSQGHLLLVSCHAARRGPHSIAQQFANALQLTVIASTQAISLETNADISKIIGITGASVFHIFTPESLFNRQLLP